MDKRSEVKRLESEFPGCKIICLPEHNPTEIICEISRLHAWREGMVTGWNQSTAVAIIGRSAPHYHRKITETYIIEEGSLILTVDNMTLNLNPGDAVIIHPGQIHSAEGTPARVRVVASPAWTPEDHILV